MCRTFVVLWLLVGSLGCASTPNAVSPQAASNQNIAAVRKYHEVWSTGRVQDLDNVVAPSFASHFIGGFEYAGLDGAKRSVLETKQAFPDWSEEIVDIITQGDKVVTRYRSTGTHRGTWDGIEATGNRVDIYEASIYRLENGKIVEQWGFWDEITLKKQMGAKPK